MPLIMLNFFYEDHYQGSNLPLNIPTLLANGDVSTATAYKGNNNHTVKKSSRYHHLTCNTREAVSKTLNGGDGQQIFKTISMRLIGELMSLVDPKGTLHGWSH